jgi:hypothetical protein
MGRRGVWEDARRSREVELRRASRPRESKDEIGRQVEQYVLLSMTDALRLVKSSSRMAFPQSAQ